ncbi:MAG TPA: FHA domain-containing protein, partial [Burkholderiaceae bacterium]|nr:FHA domain-containing protein [Burkholderiaceae bacterium]
MQLILQVVQWPEGVEQRPQMAYFDTDGGMIGRSETARLSLTDPHRMVSRFHAHVSCRGDTYYLEDMG